MTPLGERARAAWAKLARAFRAEPVTASLFVLATAAQLVPVWRDHYLPLLDWPNHMSNVFVWRHLGDPAWGFDPYYAQNLQPLPYWLEYATVYGLSLAFGSGPAAVELAQKLFLSAVLIALPLSVARYAKQLGRDPRLALIAVPLGWNVNLANGFLSYVAGLPLALFALTELDRFAERPTWRRGVVAALLGASIYFMHILVWAMYLALAAAQALFAIPFPREGSAGARALAWAKRTVVGALPAIPALAIGVGSYVLSKHMDSKYRPWTPHGQSLFDGVYNDLSQNLANVPGWLLSTLPGDTDDRLFFALVVLFLLIIATRPLVVERDDACVTCDPRTWRLELIVLVTFAIYLYLPRSLTRPFYWYAVNRRLVALLAVIAVLLPRGPIAGVRRWLLWATGVIGVIYPLVISQHFHRFNARAHGFDEVMDGLPRGTKVLPLMLKLDDPEVIVNPFNQWGTYVQFRLGGYMQFNFPLDFPLRSKATLPEPPWDRPDAFRFAAHGEPWDYFLVHGPTRIDPFVGAHDRVRLAKQSGAWELWQRLPKPAALPTPPAPPKPAPPAN